MSNRTPIKINAGKTAENSMPLFKPSWSAVRFGKDAAIFALPETAPLTAPINAGPTEQPTSPNTAKMPNIAVPPFGYAAEEIGYNGILCVELDRPEVGNFHSAEVSRIYIRDVLDI